MGSGRTIRVIFATPWLLALLWNLMAAPAFAEAPASSPELLLDAELTDVTFIDPDRGFAVGDRGVIWRTEDAGRHWRLVPSPVTCRLESVCFADDQHGWIVGGSIQQLTHQSTGVVLRTKDGGRTWSQVPKLLVSGLTHVRFFDAKHGMSMGQATEFSPAGIYRTNNGGQTWTPLAYAAHCGWNHGFFHDAQRGVVVGPRGAVMVVGGEKLTPARVPQLGARSVRRVTFTNPRQGWLVGDGGLVLATDSGGIEWNMTRGAIPKTALEQMDFRAVAVQGEHCWIAGAPGSVVLHTGDHGATWEWLRTEQNAPLRSLYFLDTQRGWAVGALGTILATRDGGRTWSVQRRGGHSVALLSLVSLPERLPLETITRLSGNEGFLSAAEVLCEVNLPPRMGRSSLEDRTRMAITQLGGSAADSSWRFPVVDPDVSLSADAIVRDWNERNSGQGPQQLESLVVRRIRQWRPEIVITERASARGEDSLAHITNQLVLNAVAKAADPAAYPEQIAELGLAVWKPKKVFSTLPPETPGMVNLSTAQLAPRLGGSLADVTNASRALILDDYQPPAHQLGFQLLTSTIGRDVAVRDFFAGIPLPAVGEARRSLSETSPTSLEVLRRQAQRARNVQQLMARSAADRSSGGSWLGQVDDLTQGLSRASAAQTLYELAWRYHHSGQWHSAADAFQLVVDRYGDQDLADAASLWLVQYYASTEAAVRQRGGTRVLSGDSGYAERPATAVIETPKPGGPEQPSLNIRAHLRTGSVGLNASQRVHRATELAQQIQQQRPRQYARPEVRFPLAAAQRQIGLSQQAGVLLSGFAQDRPRDGWWAGAVAERWLAQPTPQGPKPYVNCKRIDAKPKLDGVLDEPFWEAAAAAQLLDDRARLPKATVKFAQDGEFLYLAVRCEKIEGFDYSLVEEERKHDSDLTLHDRIELCLDVDRDYCTFYRLGIDYRGFTHDACIGDASWNPTWYVAASQAVGAWTVEAAIPLSELHLEPPTTHAAWAMGLTRILPGSGISGWHQTATAKPQGENFGLLLFE